MIQRLLEPPPVKAAGMITAVLQALRSALGECWQRLKDLEAGLGDLKVDESIVVNVGESVHHKYKIV